MIAALQALARRAGATTLTQAIRLAEQVARGAGRRARVGEDTKLAEEPVHLVASDRMTLPVGDVAAVELAEDRPPRIVSNALGLVGATPALPAFYSELQLKRRRERDTGMAGFYNIFDHRALSFFYRADTKYNWLLSAERGGGARDPISDAMLALGGIGQATARGRMALDDVVLAPLAGWLGDRRRPAAAVEAVLRQVTGLPLTVRQAEPTWMALPASEQTRIGISTVRRYARLGNPPGGASDAQPDAALLGTAVLDVQHHYMVESAPIPYRLLLSCVAEGETLRSIRDLCRLASGLEQRALLRLRISAADVPPLRLGDPDHPGLLGRTTWLGHADDGPEILEDCVIPLHAMA